MATAVSKWLSEYGRECLFVQVRLNENSIAVPETESEAETQAETGAKAEQEEPTTAAAPTEVTAKRCRQRNATIKRKKIERKKTEGKKDRKNIITSSRTHHTRRVWAASPLESSLHANE